MGWSPQVTAVPVTPGMEEMGQRAISIMQLSPAVPWRFLAQGHAGCPCAKAHSGQRPEEVLDFSLQHLYPSLTMGMLWPGRWKGLVCLGRPGRGNLLQALALSNVINENKSDKKKKWLFRLWCFFLCLSWGRGRTKDSNLSEAKCVSWNQDATLKY